MGKPQLWLTVELAGPIDLPASLRPLSRWGDDGLDRWDGRTLSRTIRLPPDGRPVAFLARPAGSVARPALLAELPGPAGDGPVAATAIRDSFAADPLALRSLAELARADPAVGSLVRRYPGLTPVLFRDPFTALVRSISAQQISLRWAVEIRRRLAATYGRRHELGGQVVHSLHPEPLARASAEQLRRLQLTYAKSRSLIACARDAAEGRLERAELEALADEEVMARLTTLPGIGPWSAEWFLARTLGRPRVVAGDLGVRKAVGRLYDAGTLPSEREVRRLTGHWGAASSLAQALALHDLAERPR